MRRGIGHQAHRREIHVEVLQPHVGVLLAPTRVTVSRQSCETSSTLALSTDVTSVRAAPAAAWNATRATRSISATV